MPEIGYNDNLEIGGRQFHIQTASNTRKGLARCEVFEKGRVISSSNIEFERRRVQDEDSMEKRIRDIVSELHKETIFEMKLLFMISNKVKKLRHAPSNVKLGLIFLRHNLIKDAIEQFETAISIDPDSAEALNNLGLAYIMLNQNNKAIQILRKALDKSNAFADIYHNLGLAYLNEMQLYKALNNFQNALHINPDYKKAHYNLALVYLESILRDKDDSLMPPPSIRLERAIQQLKKLHAFKMTTFEKIYPKLLKLLENSEIETAIETLKNSRDSVFPEELLSLIGMDFYLKFMYGGSGMDDALIRQFEKKLQRAVEKHPDYADLWNNLGIVHLIQCRNLFLEALGNFDKALELNPSFDRAIKNKKLVENDGKEFLILLRAILR